MSQERPRRPARKRQPEERLSPVPQPVEPMPEMPVDVTVQEATNDPGGWLAIGLLVMAVAAVAFYTVLTVLAAN